MGQTDEPDGTVDASRLFAENTLLYVNNGLFTAAFDGLPTLICPLISLTTFAVVAYATQRSHAPAILYAYGQPTAGADG